MRLKKQNRRPKRIRFKFTKQPRYEVSWQYAYRVKGRKKIGIFTRSSQVTKQEVTLYVQDLRSGQYRPVTVPHSVIVRDPWATVGTIPREDPPRCVLPDKQSVSQRRYTKMGGQRPFRFGRYVKNKSLAV